MLGARCAHDRPCAAQEAVDEHGGLHALAPEQPDHARGAGDASAVVVGQQRVVVDGQEAGRRGLSRSGSGAPGTSNSSRPSRRGRYAAGAARRSTISRTPVRPDQVRMSITVAGPNAARYRSTSASGVASASSGRPSHVSAPVQRTIPLVRHSPRGGTCTWARGSGTAWARSLGSLPGQRGPRWARSSVWVRGWAARRAAARREARRDRRRPGLARTVSRGTGRLQDRLHHRPQGDAVACGDEVQRGAHQREPHRLPVLDQRLQLGGVEVDEPRPQTDVGILGFLGLHPDEVLEHLGHGLDVAVEEELALEQRAVEGPPPEHLRWTGHGGRVG